MTGVQTCALPIFRKGQGVIFAEDLDMLEQQQKNLSANPQRALLMLNIDAGGVQSRRVIERLWAQEQAVMKSNSAQGAA